jgi:hypothetical protein
LADGKEQYETISSLAISLFSIGLVASNNNDDSTSHKKATPARSARVAPES